MTLLEALIASDHLTPEQANDALRLQEQWHTSLPRTLLAMGSINALSLYRIVAECEQREFVNLRETTPDVTLLHKKQIENYKRLQAIPYAQENGRVLIATPQITDALNLWAKEHYGAHHYSFAITTPYDIDDAIRRHFSESESYEAREGLWLHEPEHSAKVLFGNSAWISALTFFILLGGCAIAFPQTFWVSLFILVNSFYLITLGFKALLLFLGNRNYRLESPKQRLCDLPARKLPVYTILIPLYKESGTLPKLLKAIESLDYPKAKLDVKLIVEEDDTQTIDAIKKLRPSRIFEMICVPYSLPRTKPKACNYALRYAKGDYVTIYDAEDIPEPEQLKKALWQFEQGGEELVCVQARLNYFNRHENRLTRQFALEYASLFDFLLWGIKRADIPIPLGGTSNHFKMEALKTLYAWDPYNVTEDADLGLRIAQHGWKVGVMDSLTLEEAPITLGAWLRQRSRWIKGHMQTYLVHMRHPIRTWRTLGTIGFFGFQFFLGAPCLIFLISPLMWVIWGVGIADLFHPVIAEPLWQNWLGPLSLSTFVIGFILQISFAATVIIRHRWWEMWSDALLSPLYWFLHSFASFKALWQLLTNPHYWEKTTHGVTQMNNSSS